MQRFNLLNTLTTALILSALFLGLSPQSVSADTTGFLSLINTYRQQNNLGTLAEDQNLTNSACWFTSDMGAKNYFPSDHVDSLGRTMAQRLADFGVSGGTRGENIFYTTAGSSANDAFDAWKKSPGHNANMLNSVYTRIGIGRANYSGRWYWTTDFASETDVILNNQCGVAVNPQPDPKPANPPSPSPIVVKPSTPKSSLTNPKSTPENISPPETTTLAISTRSATLSSKLVKIGSSSSAAKKPVDLAKILVVALILLLNVGLFSFIFWQLFHHFRKPIVNS